jgi:hypothetical protein
MRLVEVFLNADMMVVLLVMVIGIISIIFPVQRHLRMGKIMDTIQFI